MSTTLVPCYGRDYKSKAAVLADWTAGKDFAICNIFDPSDGKPINRQDAEREPDRVWNVRFKRLANIAVLRFKKGKWTVS